MICTCSQMGILHACNEHYSYSKNLPFLPFACRDLYPEVPNRKKKRAALADIKYENNSSKKRRAPAEKIVKAEKKVKVECAWGGITFAKLGTIAP